MIISHKYRFIFIKTSKTAGTSIETYLSRFCDMRDIVTPIRPPEIDHFERNYQGRYIPFYEVLRFSDLFSVQWMKSVKELILNRKYYNHIPAYKVKLRIGDSIYKQYFKFAVERNPWDKTLSHFYMKKRIDQRITSFEDYMNKGQFCYNFPKYMDQMKEKIIVNRIVNPIVS